MAEQTEQTTPKPGASELREVPGDITEYKKFVAEKGLEHNAAIIAREKALEDAKAAGIEPAADDAAGTAQDEERKKENRTTQRIRRLRARVEELEKQAAARDGAAPVKPAEAGSEARPNGHAAAAATGAAKPDQKAPPPKPKEADFKTYAEYVEALTDWKTDRKLEARDAEHAKAQAAQSDAERGKAIIDAHNARVDEAKARYSDWNDAFKGLSDSSYTEPMVVFIFESEAGPDVTYWLAKNRDELARISRLTPLRQAAELGRIEAQILAERGTADKTDDEAEDKDGGEGATEKEKPKKTERTNRSVSKAPPPIKPFGGRGSNDDPMPDPSNFQAYEAWSKRMAAKGVKR